MFKNQLCETYDKTVVFGPCLYLVSLLRWEFSIVIYWIIFRKQEQS